MKSSRLVIIGIDAADHGVTSKLVEEGRMPVLSGLLARGCFTKLESTIPPQTAPAWTTITTGVNPGRHGIYYFHNFSSSPITITNATDTKTPRLWDYVAARDESSVVVNVPVTYPAQKIKGAMVAGIPPWYFDEGSVSDPALLPRLKKEGYETDAPLSRALEREPEEMAKRMVETERRRVRIFLDLLDEADWSFGMIVMTALDRLQHKAVGMGARHEEAVRRAYQDIDELVGTITQALGTDVNYVVVSDHGFNQRPVAFYPNSWLHSQGLLKRTSSFRNRLTMRAHDLFDGHLLWLPQGLTKRFQGATTVVHTIDAVDLEASRAFVPGTDGVMVVKSKGDAKAIISGLSDLKDDSGMEICKVYTREQVYTGDRVGAAPELLLVPREDINIRTDPFSPTVTSTSGKFPRGNHSSHGIFLAAGPGFKPARSPQVAIEDVTPTALAVMGIRPGSPLDGKPVEEIVRRSGDLESLTVGQEGRSHAFSEEEERQVMENLKRLGYA